jgi:hypothetical protein
MYRSILSYAIDPALCKLRSRSICGMYTANVATVGEVTKIFLSQSGPTYTPGLVCVFDGIEHALTRTKEWYRRQMKEGADGEQAREVDRIRRIEATTTSLPSGFTEQLSMAVPYNVGDHTDVPAPLPSSVQVLDITKCIQYRRLLTPVRPVFHP